MIAFDTATIIRDQLVDGLEVESQGPDSAVVYLPFSFGDGDMFSVLVTRNDDKTWRLTDEGESVERAAQAGLNLSRAAHRDRFSSLIEFFGAHESDGIIDMQSPESDLAESIFTFTQACLEATWLTRTPRSARKKARRIEFTSKLSRLIGRAIQPQYVTRKWVDPIHDQKSLYPIDYRVEGRQKQLFLFGVASEQSCMQATCACLHFKNANVDFRSLVVYDDEGKISKKHADQLNDVVDVRCPRINEQKVIQRALSRILS